MKLLDSDILIHFTNGHPKVVQRFHAETETIALPIIARIEVLRARFEYLFKAADAKQLEAAQKRLHAIEQDLKTFPVISINADAAAQFDDLRKQKKLKKIGRADILIASIALAHQATLVTRNLKHFRQVKGLKLENWAD